MHQQTTKDPFKGWLSRIADLKRIYDLWEGKAIDGSYSLRELQAFKDDLLETARRFRLLE